MIFREAQLSDIAAMHVVRTSVRENALSDPNRITSNDYETFITRRGKGWVCETDGRLVGFAVVDLEDNNIWALFVLPEYENKGIGRTLHSLMLHWYFSQTKNKLWLGTAPHTKAASFYRKWGWREVGMHGKGELKFELTYEDWMQKSAGV